MIAGGAPKNFTPSAPRSLTAASHSRAASGVWIVSTLSLVPGNAAQAKIRGGIDAVLGGGLLLLKRPRQPVDTSGLAEGGDAMRQPQLVDVIRLRHRTVFGVKRRADTRGNR